MRIKLSQDVVNALKKIQKTDKTLANKVEKQLSLFQNNPQHPSLRLHKLTGSFENRWSISITKNFRMVYLKLEENIAYFIVIGTHDQVYRK